MSRKDLEPIVFNPAQCRREIAAFDRLLKSKKQLAERADVQKFFQKRKQLSTFIGTYAPKLGPATLLGYEFPFLGDFTADIVLGNKEKRVFCVIELEDGKSSSIFTKMKNKATKEWGRRFEHGFSQLIDWFYSLDDFKKTERFAQDFGHGHITFHGLIIGRSASLSESERNRLNWRTEKVRVDSHTIECLTFDDLYEHLQWRISFYPETSRIETEMP